MHVHAHTSTLGLVLEDRHIREEVLAAANEDSPTQYRAVTEKGGAADHGARPWLGEQCAAVGCLQSIEDTVPDGEHVCRNEMYPATESSSAGGHNCARPIECAASHADLQPVGAIAIDHQLTGKPEVLVLVLVLARVWVWVWVWVWVRVRVRATVRIRPRVRVRVEGPY